MQQILEEGIIFYLCCLFRPRARSSLVSPSLPLLPSHDAMLSHAYHDTPRVAFGGSCWYFQSGRVNAQMEPKGFVSEQRRQQQRRDVRSHGVAKREVRVCVRACAYSNIDF